MIENVKKVLSVAGSDSCGGAGIQADIKTISAFRQYAMTVVTAVTAQNSLGVRLVNAVDPEMVRAQLECVFEDMFPDAVKTGMLLNGSNVNITADIIKEYKAQNVVCDTVIMSTSGKPLIDEDGLDIFVKRLMPLADVITPNIPEAQKLCGMKIDTVKDMENACTVLSGMVKGAVLIKGGHLDGEAVDILYADGKFHYFSSKRIDNKNTHGTGCTLSAAIACGLAEGLGAADAVKKAKDYITKAIGNKLELGHGYGPLWHF